MATRVGLRPDSLWDRPRDRELRQLRKDTDMLVEVDNLHVPDEELLQVTGQPDDATKQKLLELHQS